MIKGFKFAHYAENMQFLVLKTPNFTPHLLENCRVIFGELFI